MALPINIDELINGKTVEWERIEFKEGWNPEDVLHYICSFSNDINNWGGGYIIIGIAEKDGQPIFPPKGLLQNQLDPIQKKLLELCHRLTPNYFPIAQPFVFRKKHILVIWVPGGDVRPYKAPITLGEKSQSAYYIRRFSNTVKATAADEKHLIELAAKVPFDDRINQQADVSELKLPLIQSFLHDIGSDLYEESSKIPHKELCRRMNIARGPEEHLRPVNAGILFFNDDPSNYFKGAKIEIVEYHDEVGDTFSEKTFTGPIHQQLKDALSYLEKFIIKEEIRKIPRKAQAERFYNYPFEAVKEALANAVYHRSYELLNAIEVNVRLDQIEILSFPGPIPPVDNAQLQKKNVVARDYRNRRVGDFLKELHLTEGRGTGIPKIRRAMKNNGSPEPIFETDIDRVSFLTTLPIHPNATKKAQDEAHVELTEKAKSIIKYCVNPKSRKEILLFIDLSNHPKNYVAHISPLIENKFLELTIPDKPTSSKQRYISTKKGLSVLEED